MIDRYAVVYLGLFIICIFLLSIAVEQGFHILEFAFSEETQRMVLSSREMFDFMIFGITVILTGFSGFGFTFLVIYGD